jgi:hypothetical protein
MKYISLIVFGCIAIACSQKPELREGVIEQEAYLDTVPMSVSEYEISMKRLDGTHNIGGYDLLYHDSVGYTYVLPVKRIDYRHKKIFIYKSEGYTD